MKRFTDQNIYHRIAKEFTELTKLSLFPWKFDRRVWSSEFVKNQNIVYIF